MTTDILIGLKALWKEVFGDPDIFINNFFSVAFSPDRCRYTVRDGRVVSALYWLDAQCGNRKLAYIYAVATLPQYRGQGLAVRLLQDTHGHLQTLGYSGTVLKPAEGLFPYYERLGYVTTGFVRRFSAVASTQPITLKPLCVREYQALRRRYLPSNAIVQEGITLEFLHTFAYFYASEDALLCVSREEPFVFEYLGNPDSAPGILAALGIPKAELRTYGSTEPFAMYHSLDDTPAPGYLGITLE